MNPILSVVVPVYNEQEVIGETLKRLRQVLDAMAVEYEIVFVNDGSRDNTLQILRPACEADTRLKLINFSRNFGHQTAITAGMDLASGDAVVIIDADLQDPPEVIPDMFALWKDGYEVVYGKRIHRKGETFFKRATAQMFYRLLSVMTDVTIPVDTGDFRLIDRKVVEALRRTPERNRYVRGLISWLGFKQTAYEYVREERFAGKTKYPLRKMIKLAVDAITSFSVKPLRIAGVLGLILSVFGFAYTVYVVIAKLCGAVFSDGWASTICIVLLLGGFILIMLGIMGQYIGRIYDEVRARPLYVISETVNLEGKDGRD